MWTKNPKLWQAFDEGRTAEALLGTGGTFIPNATYRDKHDDTLVIDQLLDWAADRNGWDVAAGAFTTALSRPTEAGDREGAYGLVLAYLLVTEDRQEVLPVDPASLRAALEEVDRRSASADEERLRPLIDAVRQRLPS